MQDSDSEGSTRSCLDCFDLQPRHKIIYNWKPGGPLFWFSTLIWKNTSLIWSISTQSCDVRGSPPHTIISSSTVRTSSKISNYKQYTTINFIRNWTFNLFLPNVCSSRANLYSLMARPSFYERLQFNSPWRSDRKTINDSKILINLFINIYSKINFIKKFAFQRLFHCSPFDHLYKTFFFQVFQKMLLSFAWYLYSVF